MPGRMKWGQSIFIPFKDGESIYDSQNKARMYMSEEKFRASFPGWRFGEVDLVEYSPKPHWISVEERLPEPYRVVLVHRMPVLGGNGYTAIDHVLAGFHFDGTWFEDLHTWKSKVTHWMPLPEPPKEET